MKKESEGEGESLEKDKPHHFERFSERDPSCWVTMCHIFHHLRTMWGLSQTYHNGAYMSRYCHELLPVCINRVVNTKSASEKFIRNSMGAQACPGGSLSTDAMLPRSWEEEFDEPHEKARRGSWILQQPRNFESIFLCGSIEGRKIFYLVFVWRNLVINYRSFKVVGRSKWWWMIVLWKFPTIQ